MKAPMAAAEVEDESSPPVEVAGIGGIGDDESEVTGNEDEDMSGEEGTLSGKNPPAAASLPNNNASGNAIISFSLLA